MPTLKALQVLELYLCLDRAEKEKFDADIKQMQLPAQALPRQLSKKELAERESIEAYKRKIMAVWESAHRRRAAKKKD